MRANPLTSVAHLDRLLALMAWWWQAGTLAPLAREYGISRQRVAVILASVGCSRARWRRADHDRPDSTRRAMPSAVAQARAALLHPLAFRLTVRQRSALAWQAQGLVLADIARRMGTTPQNVRNLQVAGRWRLDRLSRAKAAKDARAPGRQRGSIPASPDGGMSVNWQNLFRSPASSPATPPETAQERPDVAHVATG